MSWAEEDWTVGLSGRVLQKVKELQVHQERLSRENKQKQLQLDNINTSLEKQTVKYEEVRRELHSVQRELQSVREEAKAAVTSRERLTQELQTKQAQICSLEGQLDAARTLSNKLTQEIKRLETELEKLQNTSRPADITLFSTPCWNTTSPWENNGSRQEDRLGQRDEGQSQATVRRLQFSDVPTASLPRQQQKSTPHRHPSDQSDVFSTPLAAFPWERDDSRPAARRRLPPSPQMPCPDVTNQGLSEQRGCGKEKDLRTETDTSLSEMRHCISALEDELSVKAGTLKSIQNEMVQSKKELAAKELNLQKIRDELRLAQTRMAQDSERASGAEHRLKQLQEELKCQRQNAESSRLQHQQRTKELEKQHQRDLTELQKERQCLERQHQQEVNKLNQELQQARTLHNALQAQADKLSLQKQALEKELDTVKEKLKWTEGQLKESQKKETQTQAKLTEAVREAEGVAVSLEQSRKRERALEEEGKRLTEELADALRLIKELQEQKSVPAPPPEPVQFCPVGQSFPHQSSFSHHLRPSTHSKRPASTRVEQRREEEEDVDTRRAEVTASYPSDREPGEGIDSEHITVLNSPDSECLQRAGHRRKSNEEDKRSINELIDSDMSGTSKSCVSAPINLSVDCDKVIDPEHSTLAQSSMLSAEKTHSPKSEQTVPSEDLKRENAVLRSEIQDVREELQKRLEDLETQRRAEAEARTRLKQLSRKHSSQTMEREEKDKEWKAQLESEKAETERLRRTISALEAEMKTVREERDKEEREEQEEEKNQAQEDRESEMIELNIQLKKQLSEVKAQLALEREERKREEEDRNQITNTDSDVKMELSIKLAELQAEVEELKRRGKDDSQEEERLSVANSPLTYLTLHDDELNSNIISCDGKLLPSPEQHLLFCQSTNQRNMLVSQATADIIQEEQTVIDAEHSPLSDDVQTCEVASDLSKQNYPGGSSPSDLQKNEVAASDLAKEMQHLRKEYAKETERANQYQVKLEALQNQVTCQTQQLTMAFEKQSQHISGLLAELQEKESALLSQGEELLQCKQELDVLKTEKEEDIKAKDMEEEGQRQQQDEKLVESSEMHPKQEKECLITHHTADDDLNLQKDAGQPKTSTCIAETATSSSSEQDNAAPWPGEQHPDSVDSNNTQRNHDSACVKADNESGQNGGATDMVTELLTLRQENQLLKQQLEDLTISDTRSPTLQTDFENRDDKVKQSQNTGDAAMSCLMEQKTHNVPNDVMTEELQSLHKNVKKSEDEGHDLQREDTPQVEEDLDEASQAHINYLQQQVEALQMQVRALSEETQQKTEELAIWRLASQPAPTFDQFLQSTDDHCGTQEQKTHNQAQTVQEPMLATQKNQGNITVIREDELFLNCSSNKLQGRTLFSRLQSSNVVEPKSLHPSKKTAALQEYNQDTAKTDQESEKENQEINFLQRSDACPGQSKLKRDTELIQISSDKMAQQHIAKDPHKTSGPDLTKTESCTGRPENRPDSSRATSEINTISYPPDRRVKLEMKSVSSQTEASLCPRGVTTVCATTQTEEEEEKEEELVDSPPVSPTPMSEDKVLFSGSFPIPADPARLAERIRRNRTQLSAAYDDTEYEPYGLPEVVMKGFADIPSGPSCPYIVRRGLLGTTVVPASQKDTEQGEQEDETD